MKPVVRDNFGASQFDAYIDGAVAASLHYQIRHGEMWLLFTDAGNGRLGRELASSLIHTALSDAQRRRLAVRPFCPKVRHMIATLPNYLMLVPHEERLRLHSSLIADKQEAERQQQLARIQEQRNARRRAVRESHPAAA
jgi:predicted GNAT family acetyltransferase